jgi:hypothetical protein
LGSKTIKSWADKIDWKRRVSSVCKPCWELKYCPYGPLVEEFPIQEERSNKSCIIFGHDCPVFYAAEPFTETKELRRISRHIPRDIQFKVLKRDNQICQICGKNVLENDIHFDHIIPYSKGGPTEDYNIRLVCSACNLKKSDNFEEDYLVGSFKEHVTEPIPVSFIGALLDSCRFYHDFMAENQKEPDLAEYSAVFSDADGENIGDIVKASVDQIVSLLANPNKDFFGTFYPVMRYRWGFDDQEIHSVSETLNKFSLDLNDFYKMEIKFVNHIGWYIENDQKQLKKWAKL